MPDPARRRDAIAVIDYGSQYTQLIVRRVRECKVYCESLAWDAPASVLHGLEPRGIILSGGPSSVYDEGAPNLAAHILAQGVPVLGICYGMQLLAHSLGGAVSRAQAREYGVARLTVDESAGPLLAPLGEGADVWMSHGDRIERLPPGFRSLARSANSPFAAMGDDRRGVYGLQFHPEVVHTQHGQEVLRAFCLDICGSAGDWTPGAFVDESIASIRRQVGEGRIICAVSGGVDSTVVATLVRRAVGEQLTAVFVDTGLLRQDEAQESMDLFQQHLAGSVVHVDARERFLSRLAGVSDPEEKRVRIGREFIAVFEEQARRVGRVDFLAQGTLYPDVIESAGTAKSAAKIKTHHNVGGLPANMRLTLVEPLRNLFKDEVRDVGLALGLSETMVYRQPFPGPGLAVRIIGPVTQERVRVLQSADAIVREEIARARLDRDIWQYFAVLTPVRSVGVMGDTRTYSQMAAIRAVTSEDGMTADWARIPFDVLAVMSTRIVNEIPEINRVVYDISSKPPATIEWE